LLRIKIGNFFLQLFYDDMKISGINNTLFDTRSFTAPNRAETGKNLSFGSIEDDTCAPAYAWNTTTYNGRRADSKILDVLRTLPKGSNVADIGAGDGRNTLALARGAA